MAGHRKYTASLSEMQYLIMGKNRPPFCLSAYFIYLCKRGSRRCHGCADVQDMLCMFTPY